MSDASRRTFLVAAGAGAAAVGIASIAPATASAATSGSGSSSGEPLVAYVSDASTGELTLLVGEREVLVKNHALVSQLHAALD